MAYSEYGITIRNEANNAGKQILKNRGKQKLPHGELLFCGRTVIYAFFFFFFAAVFFTAFFAAFFFAAIEVEIMIYKNECFDRKHHLPK